MPNELSRIVHVGLAEALTKGPPPHGNLAVPIFSNGSLVVELYTPVGHDPQKPQTRDEVYFVVRGKGQFFDGETLRKGWVIPVCSCRPDSSF